MHASTRAMYYSTDQMQGIRRTRFDRILIVFITSDERVYRQRRTHLLLAANALIASDERAFSDGDERV